MVVFPSQEGAGTWNPLRNKAVNLQRRPDWDCLGGRVSYKLCSCLALALFSGACVPLPPLQGVCPQASGSWCLQRGFTHLLNSYLLELWGQRQLTSCLPLKMVSVQTVGRSSLLPSHPILFSRTLSFSLTPRTLQFPTDVLWQQCLGKSWQSGGPRLWAKLAENSLRGKYQIPT